METENPDVITDDEKGYLTDPESWNENIARQLARREGIDELTDEMMDVIRFMRTFYKTYGSFPILNSVCKNVQQPKECVNEEFIDPLKAWKIAGLPYPGEEVIYYLNRPL
ncbi:MAG: TusE/DsrC/DsvC family sulfur relay protein [Thermoleophilia bacterium]